MTDAFPLQWPSNRPRTPPYQRKRARFDAPLGNAVAFVLDEIRRMSGTLPVISSDLELRRDGLPYSIQRQPADQGAAVYFSLKGRQMAFACDRWDKIADNLQAIGKTIEALRGIERWGSGSMVEAAFSGFVALPAPAMHSPENWGQWFRVNCAILPDCRINLDNVYRVIAKRHADDEMFLRDLNIARDAARKELA